MSNPQCVARSQAQSRCYHTGLGAHTAAFVCHAFARKRHRPALHTGIAWARKLKNHRDIHPCEHLKSFKDYQPGRPDKNLRQDVAGEEKALNFGMLNAIP